MGASTQHVTLNHLWPYFLRKEGNFSSPSPSLFFFLLPSFLIFQPFDWEFAIQNMPSWFQFHSIALAVTLCECVFLLTFPYTCTLCPMFSSCVRPRKTLHLLKEGQNSVNHLIVHCTYLCRMIGTESVFLSFLYIKRFELGVKVAFYIGSAVAHNKVDLQRLKHPRRCSCFERIDDAFCNAYLLLLFLPLCLMVEVQEYQAFYILAR